MVLIHRIVQRDTRAAPDHGTTTTSSELRSTTERIRKRRLSTITTALARTTL